MTVYELQEQMVQGRPVYKKQGKMEFLFYGSNGKWIVGSDPLKTGGWVRAPPFFWSPLTDLPISTLPPACPLLDPCSPCRKVVLS